jgi:hypothetical protein
MLRFTSTFLIVCGVLTVGSTVALAAIAAIYPGRIPVALPAALLGVSVAQLVTIFFNRPGEELGRLFSREAIVRMLLESRSLRLALARYHLTTPQALHGADADSRVKTLHDQIKLLAELDETDFDRFDSFSETSAAHGEFHDGKRR